jgi:large subunit ribosomal protein L35
MIEIIFTILFSTNVPLHLKQSIMTEGVGQTVLSYEPPLPPKGTHRHRYTLLVLEQTANRKEPLVLDANVLPNRHIDVANFLKQYHLVPRGITFFRSEWDETVNELYPKIHGK